MSSRTDLLKWDEDHDEPYLLIPRFPELRLTPWRESDTNDAVSIPGSSEIPSGILADFGAR